MRIASGDEADLVEAIYDSTAQRTLWPMLLDRIAQAANGNVICLFDFDPGRQRLRRALVNHLPDAAAYHAHYAVLDPRNRYGVRQPAGSMFIDAAFISSRLKGGGGRIVDVVVPPEAKKLDQIKVGDLVTVEYARAVSLTLKKAGDGIRESTAQSATAGAPAGAVAGGAAANQVTILANVTAVNKKEGYVTLRGPKGNSVDLAVPDPSQLKLVKVGDQVEVVYTVAMAITVDAAAKPAKR